MDLNLWPPRSLILTRSHICTYHAHIISCTYHVDQCGCESCHVLPCLAMSCGYLSRLICVVSLSYPCRGLNWTSFPTEARRLGSCWACRCNLKPRGHTATASPGTAYHLHHLHHLHLCHSVSLCVSLCPAYSDNPISGIDDASAHLTLKCIGMHWISLLISSHLFWISCFPCTLIRFP